jgi:hypothetical protein
MVYGFIALAFFICGYVKMGKSTFKGDENEY